MQLSYWDKKLVYKVDYTVVVVELWDRFAACAKTPESKILVLERNVTTWCEH
jgi:hypothetical protein